MVLLSQQDFRTKNSTLGKRRGETLLFVVAVHLSLASFVKRRGKNVPTRHASGLFVPQRHTHPPVYSWFCLPKGNRSLVGGAGKAFWTRQAPPWHAPIDPPPPAVLIDMKQTLGAPNKEPARPYTSHGNVCDSRRRWRFSSPFHEATGLRLRFSTMRKNPSRYGNGFRGFQTHSIPNTVQVH